MLKPWQTFVDQVRLNGRDFYILWQSQFDFDVRDRVVSDPAGQILVFGSDDEAGAYAANRFKDLQQDGRMMFDLDAVREWCRQPDAATLDADLVWRTWHLLRDSEAAEIPLAFDGEPGHSESEIFDNLLVWATDDGSEWCKRAKREWRSEDIRALARILGDAIEKLESKLHSRPV